MGIPPLAAVRRAAAAALLCAALLPAAPAESLSVAGLRAPVEILRDRWGVPHIYAAGAEDLFFAQGWVTARDRLFQIDLWRRIGTGKLAEAIGPKAVARDRLARAVRYRGDWDAEWRSYAPDSKQIATAFVAGINAYIRSLGGNWPPEFRRAGYAPGMWAPEDCVARVAGLQMTRNLLTEVQRARDLASLGEDAMRRRNPVDPPVEVVVPKGLNPADITPEIARVYNQIIAAVNVEAGEGSNNWAVSGARTVTGKPLLAGDPHRALQIPSLRKTVHLVAPGWNIIGAGEPALPGVAIGHNDRIAFAFTIAGIDQQDLYVEELHPRDPNRYRHNGAWRRFEIERHDIAVKGSSAPRRVEIKYSVHGPVLHEDAGRKRAYALRWVGMEPGTAGYLASLTMGRARNWQEFRAAAARFKVPSQNMVYADVDGNIGWQMVGLTPVRKGWNGLLPAPGTGDYEWTGFLPADELPRVFNPASQWVATANHNTLPPGYPHTLGFEFAAPFRYRRVAEMLGGPGKFGVRDFERMQQDVVSLPARRFQEALRQWQPAAGSRAEAIRSQLLAWNASLDADSVPAAIYQAWVAKLRPAAPANAPAFYEELAAGKHTAALEKTLVEALKELESRLGADPAKWTWGRLHQVHFRHPLSDPALDRGPRPRPGDGNTVNAAGGAEFRNTHGASYRQIIDLADWDRSVMTNTPGESGDPASPHYADLMDPWARGEYHPMPFSRQAVEAAASERIRLQPAP